MRLLIKLPDQRHAYRLSMELHKNGINNFFEAAKADKGTDFQVWVIEEDQFDSAKHIAEQFNRQPVQENEPEQESNAPSPSIKPPPDSRLKELADKIKLTEHVVSQPAIITKFIIFVCVGIFIYNAYYLMQFMDAKKETIEAIYSPLTRLFLYDFPKGAETLGKSQMWTGFYYILLHWPESSIDFSAPMFEKIKQGQIWRLFTPCIVHQSLLHILFNMLWLWALGKQIELRTGAIRYILLTLLLGIGSNTAQYLMSGFSFIGYSGVISGLAAYIWYRQKHAPWEGYLWEKGVALFLVIFILGISALQVVSFALNYYQIANFPLHIANTAHISGAILGLICARIPWFSK